MRGMGAKRDFWGGAPSRRIVHLFLQRSSLAPRSGERDRFAERSRVRGGVVRGTDACRGGRYRGSAGPSSALRARYIGDVPVADPCGGGFAVQIGILPI